MRRRTALGLIGAAVTAGLAGATRAAPKPEGHTQPVALDIDVNGRARTAWAAFGPAPDSSRPAPLVIGFHGGAGNAEGYISNSQLLAKGTQAGFVVVCPQGTPIQLRLPGDHRVWNSGPEYEAASGGADDVLFARQLIAEAGKIHAIDPARIFLTGFSNGAQMAYRLALELSNRIAAIAPMSGGRLAGGERPSRPVPVMHFHGAADSVYPFAGGLGAHSLGRTPHAPIEQVIREWVAFDQASPTPEVQAHGGWELQHHGGPAAVDLLLVSGMGHQIAGGGDNHLPDQALSPAPDAVAMALKFFADQALS